MVRTCTVQLADTTVVQTFHWEWECRIWDYPWTVL